MSRDIDPSISSKRVLTPVGPVSRRAIEGVILIVAVVLLIRALLVEPYGVPTGSMAMTLLGHHKCCDCPRCGFPVTMGGGSRGPEDPGDGRRCYQGAWCPNCGCPDLPLTEVPEAVGDRLLVDKNSFEWRQPRRWEIAVFRNPSDGSKPYVKRIVGLPGEQIQILDGDVYANEEICRKSLDEARPLRILVFDQTHLPTQTWRNRWVDGDGAGVSAPLNDPPTALVETIVQGPELRWSESRGDREIRWITYRHWLLDERREEVIRDWFAYNGGSVRHELSEVHDFSVEFEVTPESGEGTLALMLNDGRSAVHVEIPIVRVDRGQQAVTVYGLAEPKSFTLSPGLVAGQTRHLEFALVDRRISLEMNGEAMIPPIDLPAWVARRGVSRPFAVGVRGAAVTIRRFRLYRDVHYTSTGRNAIHSPWPLGRDEYFMLGDNSANSEDSRHWSKPGVPLDHFLGRPLLLHQPSRWSRFGEWRFQCLDWRRIRWVH